MLRLAQQLIRINTISGSFVHYAIAVNHVPDMAIVWISHAEGHAVIFLQGLGTILARRHMVSADTGPIREFSQ